MRKILAVLLVLMLAGTASAYTTAIQNAEMNSSEINVTQVFEQTNFSEATDQINNQTSELPPFVKSLIGNQRINIYFEDSDLTLGIVMDGSQVEDIVETSVENPSLEIWIGEGDIQAVVNSESPGQELVSRLKNGEIRYEVHGMVNRIKFFFVRIFAGF